MPKRTSPTGSEDNSDADPVRRPGVLLREIARRFNDGLRDQMPDAPTPIDRIL